MRSFGAEIKHRIEGQDKVDLPSLSIEDRETRELSELPDTIGEAESGEDQELNALPDKIGERVENIKEYKLPECAEIAKDYFPAEVIKNWADYNVNERQRHMERFGEAIVGELGSQYNGMKWFGPEEDIGTCMLCGHYDIKDMDIHLNKELIDDPDNIFECVKTVAHEARHKFQEDVLAGRVSAPIDASTREIWITAAKNYNSPASSFNNPEGYYHNPLETDARYFESIAAAVGNKTIYIWRN